MNIVLRLPIIFLIALFIISCDKTTTSSDPVTITFADDNFEALIRESIDKPIGDIFDTDLGAIIELVGIDLNIIDLTGIEYCINLTYLDLSQNQITDIAPISENNGLDTGDFVDLQGNPLSDTSKDTYIPQLETRGVKVYYDEPEMVVTFPDANLEALIREVLEKPTGDITNLELANITRIFNRNSETTNLAGIEFCKNLSYLFLENHNITDITKLGALWKLKELYLFRNNIENIDILDNHPSLINIGVSNNNISDISVLLSLTKLKWITIGYNPITNLDVVSGLTSLEYISINKLNVTSLDLISGLTNLKNIEARNNQISDISALTNFVSLEYLAINNNQISDISVIANLSNSIDINFNDNNITDISAIVNLPNLTGCGFADNQISDISALSSGYESFKYFYAPGNQISDISALVDNVNVGDGDTVYLKNNPLSEKSINTYIPQLEARGVTVDL